MTTALYYVGASILLLIAVLRLYLWARDQRLPEGEREPFRRKLYRWIAYRLPIPLVSWCMARVWGYAQSRRERIPEGQTVMLDTSISFDDALRIWEQSRDRKVWGHSQKLGDQKGWSLWRYGRAWWHIYETQLHAEWHFFGKTSTAIGFSFAGEEMDFGIHVALDRLFSIYLSIDHTPILHKLFRPIQSWHGYETAIKFFDHSVWVHFAYNELFGARSIKKWFLPKWVSLWKSIGSHNDPGVGFYFSIDYFNVLLGSMQHEKVYLWENPITAEIPIEPDNSLGFHYTGTFMAERHTWWRKRFPMFKDVHHYVDIRVEKPPMHTGKGENSYDLDDDGIFGMGAHAKTIEEAIAAYQEAVKRDRKRYGMGSDVYNALEKIKAQDTWRALMNVQVEQGSGGVVEVPFPPDAVL